LGSRFATVTSPTVTRDPACLPGPRVGRMARVVLCAVSLASAISSALAEHGPLADAAALFQMGQAHMESSGDAGQVQQEAPRGPSDKGYAFEKYKEGSMVEGQGKDGQWVPCVIKRLNGKLWDLHVASEFPGFELPHVPASLVRRLLGPGESDWYVGNAELQRKGGRGVMYRLSKDMADTSTDYAPWGTLVVGSDEGDGWLKVSRGYLPLALQGAPVLAKRGRDTSKSVAPPQAFVDWYQAREEEKRKAKKPPPPPLKLTYRAFETVKFTNSDGQLFPAKVITRGWRPDSYNLLVLPGQPGQYFVSEIPAEQLQKDHRLRKHDPVDGESPLCQKQGCVALRMRTASGTERTVHAGMLVSMESLAKQACAMLQLPWESCQREVTLVRKGYALSPSMRTFDVGFKDGDVVDIEVAED